MTADKRLSRRLSARITANCSVNREPSPLPSYFLSVTKDISPKGARIVSSGEIKAGECLGVGLELPTSFIPLLAYCEVVWAKKEGSLSEAGIKFLKIDVPDAQKLTEFFQFSCEP